MEKKTMTPDKTQEANPEQLLKLLEMQVAAARERRMSRETSRSKAGTIGLFIITAGAALALWILTLLLGQMRPQRGESNEVVAVPSAESAR